MLTMVFWIFIAVIGMQFKSCWSAYIQVSPQYFYLIWTQIKPKTFNNLNSIYFCFISCLYRIQDSVFSLSGWVGTAILQSDTDEFIAVIPQRDVGDESG